MRYQDTNISQYLNKTTTIKEYHNFNISVNEYYKKGKNNDFTKPAICPICGKDSTCLVGWGYYMRSCCNGYKWYDIYIKIFKCKLQESGGYISIQPTFLLPHRSFTFSVIYQILHYYLLLCLTMTESIDRVFRCVPVPRYQTVQYWLCKMKEVSGYWIGIIQKEGKFTLPCPKKGSVLSPVDLVHLMMVIEKYFKTNSSLSQKRLLHARLLQNYHASPFSTGNPK